MKRFDNPGVYDKLETIQKTLGKICEFCVFVLIAILAVAFLLFLVGVVLVLWNMASVVPEALARKIIVMCGRAAATDFVLLLGAGLMGWMVEIILGR